MNMSDVKNCDDVFGDKWIWCALNRLLYLRGARTRTHTHRFRYVGYMQKTRIKHWKKWRWKKPTRLVCMWRSCKCGVISANFFFFFEDHSSRTTTFFIFTTFPSRHGDDWQVGALSWSRQPQVPSRHQPDARRQLTPWNVWLSRTAPGPLL